MSVSSRWWNCEALLVFMGALLLSPVSTRFILLVATGNQHLKARGERTLRPSRGNPPNPPWLMFSKVNQNRNTHVMSSARPLSYTILESLIITMPNSYFNMCHSELQSLGCILKNADQSKHGIRLAVPPPAWPCPDPQQLQLLGGSAHFVFQCRDSVMNGNDHRWESVVSGFAQVEGARIVPFSWRQKSSWNIESPSGSG